jgi:transposase
MMYATMTISGSDHRWPDGKRLHLLAALLGERPLTKSGAPMLRCMTANTQPAPRCSRRRRPPEEQHPGRDSRSSEHYFCFGSAHHEAAAQPGLPRAVPRQVLPFALTRGVMLLASATLYVGTDISEKVNRTRFYDGSGKEIGARLESVNDLPGSRDLAQEAISRAVLSDAKEILWGLEATNLFWWHLATFLTTNPELLARGLKCYTFNPRQVSKFKESYPDIGKDDWTDAMVIADRLRFGRLPAECYLDERYQPLQRLTRYRRHLVRQLVREKNLALSYVYLKLSAYSIERPLSDTFGATSQQILEGYLTPDEIVAAPIEELAALIKEHSRGRVADPEEVAKVVKQAANRSYALPKSMVEPVNLILSSSLTSVRTLKAQLKPIEKAIATELRATPPQTLQTIPGLGPVFAAGIVSEIGDVRRFEREESLAKFCGLTWRRHQSGEFEGESRPLTKTGNAYLRYYMVEAANSVRLSCPEEFGSYYQKKFAEATRHRHRRALVLTARKLVRLVHSMLRSGRIYQPPATRGSR